jgi:hypothetical protein
MSWIKLMNSQKSKKLLRPKTIEQKATVAVAGCRFAVTSFCVLGF